LAIGRNRYVARDRIHATGSAVTKNQQQRTVFMPIPAPVDNIASFGSTLAFDTNAIVSIKQSWWDDWTLREDLTCTAVAWQVAPNVGYCQLHRRYGPTTERDGSFANRTKLNLDGWYVRIEVICADGSRLWHGFIDDTGEEESGFVAISELDIDLEPIVVQRPTGKQTFTGVGMLAALDRSPILATMFRTTEANQGVVFFDGPALDEMRWAESAPHFNPTVQADETKRNVRQIETRTSAEYFVPDQTAPLADAAVTRESHIFGWVGLYSISDDLTTLALWTTRQIVKYLVAYASPRNRDFQEVMPIHIDSETQIPNFGTPDIDCDGLTLKQALDRVLSENQGLGYWCYVDEPTNQLRIVPYTILRDAVTVGSDTIPANAVQFDLYLVTDPVTKYTLQRSISSRFNQVVIRGAKRKKVFTIPFARLANGWTSTELTAFNTAFPDPATPDLASENAKRDAMEQAAWRHIYRNFVFLHTWDFRVTANDIDYWHLFENEDIYKINETSGRYFPYPSRMRILDLLPLKDRIKYETGDKKAEHKTSRAAFRRPNLYGRAHSETFGVGGSTTMDGAPKSWVERAKRHTLYSVNDPDYSVEVKPLKSEHSIGVAIDVLGAPQTVMSNNTALTISHLPPLMYSSLFVTLAIEDDRHVEKVYPAAEFIDEVDNVFRKVIDFGDRFEEIELLDGTIVGFDTLLFLQRDGNTYIRDDSTEMETLARQVYEFYNRTRHILRVNTRRSTSLLWPGQFVKDLNPIEAPTNQHAVEVNCIISEVAITLPVGNDGAETKPTFSIVTNRGDIDFLYYAPRNS